MRGAPLPALDLRGAALDRARDGRRIGAPGCASPQAASHAGCRWPAHCTTLTGRGIPRRSPAVAAASQQADAGPRRTSRGAVRQPGPTSLEARERGRPQSPCASCWRPASTSATRRGAGTRRCAASSSPSAAASTSSTCSRRSALVEDGARLRPQHRARAAAACCSSAPRSRPGRHRGERRGRRQPYVNHRWLGGLLTNFRTIQERIAYLHELRRLKAEGQLDLLPTKERQASCASSRSSRPTSAASADMRRLPDAVFVIDLKAERSRSARRAG